VKQRVQSIPANTLLNASEHDLKQAQVQEFRLDVPVPKKGLCLIKVRGG
jgi:hypothetical protein